MTVLVTGTVGFIGDHVAERRGDQVVGFDVVNGDYDVTLRDARLDRLARYPSYHHVATARL